MKKRSGPIYVRSGGKVISLVEEMDTREIRLPTLRVRLRLLSPSALYVIDERGVERLGFRQAGVWSHLVMWSIISNLSKTNKEHQSRQALSVFGKPHAIGNKTLIPVRSVLHMEPLTDSSAIPLSHARPVGMIEVRNGNVRVQPMSIAIPFRPVIIFLAACWLAKTVQRWRSRR